MGRSIYDDTGDAGSTGDYIWLRYATRFSVGAREYTLEMGVPMPIGASEDEREQLLREADAGMNQLAGFVENKVALMLQRVQPNQGPLPTPKPTERPSGPFSPAPAHSVPPAPASPPAPRVARPASVPAAQTAAQPMQPAPAHPSAQITNRDVREVREVRDIRDARDNRDVREVREGKEASSQYVAPPPRSPVGATMQLATTGETSGNLTLPQFITIIRDTMNLNPKQAMEMLHIKSLNNVNLRDALEKLRTIIESGDVEANGAAPTTTTSKPVPTPTPTDANQKTRETASSPKVKEKTPTIKPVQATPEAKPAQTTPPPTPTPAHTGGNPALNIPGLTLGTSSLKSVPKEQRPTYTFDEEEGPPEDEDNLDDLLEDLDDAEEEEELTQQQRAQARALINQFRESRGPTVANAARLQVLHNVIIGQIDEEELLQLIQGIWDVNSVKKLKVDQAELLISWAKIDEFFDEVKAVLTVLEEEM